MPETGTASPPLAPQEWMYDMDASASSPHALNKVLQGIWRVLRMQPPIPPLEVQQVRKLLGRLQELPQWYQDHMAVMLQGLGLPSAPTWDMQGGDANGSHEILQDCHALEVEAAYADDREAEQTAIMGPLSGTASVLPAPHSPTSTQTRVVSSPCSRGSLVGSAVTAAPAVGGDPQSLIRSPKGRWARVSQIPKL